MASRSLGQLTLDMVLKTGNFSQPLKKAGRDTKAELQGMQAEAAKTGKLIRTALGAIGATALFSTFLTETISAQQEQAQLAAALRSTGEAAGYTQKQLNAMAAELAGRVKIFGEGEINQAQTALLAFTGIVGDQYPKALQAAADMSARTGMSIQSAAETIGRALDVPSQGMAALSRQGFRFTEEQKKVVAELERTGQAAKAQEIILKALNESYGGAADAAGKTLGGALIGLREQINTLITGESGIDAATQAVNGLTEALASPLTAAAIDGLKVSAAALAVVISGRLVSAGVASATTWALSTREALRYQAALVSMAGVSRATAISLTAQATAGRLAAASLALIGGPVGAAVLAGGGLAYFVTQAISSQREAERLAGAARGLNKELQETNRIYELYAAQQSEVAKSSLSGLGQEALQEQFDKSSKLVELYTQRLDKLRQAGATLARQNSVSENLEQQQRIIAEINKLMPNATTSQSQFAEKLRDVTQSLEDQIYELENGKTAYELLLATRRAGVEADSKEAVGIAALISKRDELAASIKATEDAQREAARAAETAQQEQIKLSENQAAALRGQIALNNELAVFSQRQDFEVAAIGMGDNQRRQMEEQFQVREEFARRRRELEERQQVQSTRMEQEAYDRAIKALEDTENKKLNIIQVSAEKRAKAEGNWINGATRAYDNYIYEAANAAKISEGFFTSMFSSMENSVTQFALTGKFSFSDFTKSILSDMARIASQQAASQLLGMLVSWGVSAWAGSGPSGTNSTDYTGADYQNWIIGKSEGGYTGPGGKYQPAGVVHKGEVVWSQQDIARAGGVGVVEAMRKGYAGYANGGAVGADFTRMPAGVIGTANNFNFDMPITIEGTGNGQQNGSIDQEAFRRGLQQQFKFIVMEEMQKAWRPGGINYKAARGIG